MASARYHRRSQSGIRNLDRKVSSSPSVKARRYSSGERKRRLSKPCEPISSERIAFCRLSLKVRPIAMTSPTDFIWVVNVASAWGNFSKVKRGILVTT
jgi:hypothetical protein